jgi:hypothetical protein
LTPTWNDKNFGQKKKTQDMRTGIVKLAILFLVISLCLLGLYISEAGGSYVLSESAIGYGGGTSSGGRYVLTGTIGQPDAGYSAGGQYKLLGGFWPGGSLCIVDMRQFVRFAEHWLETGCDADNDWCGGADLDRLGNVDGIDLRLFVDEWLYYCPYNWPLR